MRDIKTLFKILLNEYQNNSDNSIRDYGICRAITILELSNIISSGEKGKLQIHLYINKPLHTYSNSYWWKPGNTVPRIKFLNELIKKL